MIWKKILCAVLVVLIGVSFFTLGLSIQEKTDNDKLESLCKYSAQRAVERLQRYEERGSQYDYHYAVAELTGFYNTFFLLTVENTGSTDSNCLSVNQLLGVLMEYPELEDRELEILIIALEKLSNNIEDNNAYDDLLAVYNALTR